MPYVYRVKARWSGFVGAPGYSVFHFLCPDASGNSGDAGAAAGAVRSLFDGIKSQLAPPVTIQVMSDVEVINTADDKLSSVQNAGTVTPVVSTGAAGTGYAAPVGAVITWRTGGVVNGRRVQGKTFLVPLISTAYQADGSINSVALGQMQTAAASLMGFVGTARFGVYARPVKEDPNDPGIVARTGSFHEINNLSIPDMCAVLRSRRD